MYCGKDVGGEGYRALQPLHFIVTQASLRTAVKSEGDQDLDLVQVLRIIHHP